MSDKLGSLVLPDITEAERGTQNRYGPPEPKDDTPILGLLPDGTGYVATRRRFEQEKAAIERRIYVERSLRTGENIAGGLGGTLGYFADGDVGSDIGSLVDAAALGLAPHPLNTQEVVGAPRNYVHGAPTHLSSPPKAELPSEGSLRPPASETAIPVAKRDTPPQVAERKLLAPGGTPSETLEQVQRRRGTNRERGEAGKRRVRELNQAGGEKASWTDLGKRQDDVTYDRPRSLTRFEHEVKNYRVWIRSDGKNVKNTVPLDNRLREQIDKNFVWRREGKRVGEDRVVQWDFTGAGPSPELERYLQLRKIPYTVHH